MTSLNTEWAVRELDRFIDMTVTEHTKEPGLVGFYETAASSEEITQQLQVVEMIVRRVLPIDALSNLALMSGATGEWKQVRPLCLRAKSLLERKAEIEQNLGDGAPEMSASKMHPWIWDGAASLWKSGHFREAVEGAIRKLNAETQNKLGRRDVSETDLFNQAFSDQEPVAGKPRLRRMKDDGSKTFKSVQRGARSFAEGVFAGIRNPLAHEADQEMPEQQALEYLAALSVLARWVDESTLEVAP
ncbi:MAG: restriction endonuclease [Candidatus Leucobacter sulfamidivorax]|nr:restriction endonuclease [Candidatus Leucobacter sulfamidivorax]